MTDKNNAKKSENNSTGELIDWSHVGLGIYEALKKSERLFDDAKFLYDNNKFATAIPIFVNSIEESLKSHELTIKFRKYQSLSKNGWNKLQDHKHKLLYVKEFVIANLEKMNQEQANDMTRETFPDANNIDIDQMKNFMKNMATEDSQLQNLKEKCVYTDWNSEDNEWDNFDKLDKSKQEDLAFYVMNKAKLELTQLRLGIEQAVNVLRRDGKMIKDLPFPKYNEFRLPKDFEILKSVGSLSKNEHQKFDRGRKIMKRFVVSKSFGIVYQTIPSEQLKKYLKLTKKHPDDQWFPHPIIRALLMAITASEQKENDGNFMGMSGDAEETHDGEPVMATHVIVSKEKGIIKPMKIIIRTNDVQEFEFSDKIIEKILDSDMVIERLPGKEIPLDVAHEAFSKIGIKLRKLKDNEIEPAISFSKKLIEEKRIVDLSPELISKIQNATKENWDDLDPFARSSIATFYSTILPKEENQMMLSGYDDSIPKFKVRNTIYEVLRLDVETTH